MVTEQRDLRTGTTYWQSRAVRVEPPALLTKDVTTDVLVIGAGITGAVVAEVASRSRQTVVVDRRGIAKGSTLASTALIEHEIDEPLTLLAEEVGEAKAARAWLRCRSAVRNFGANIEALGIDCEARSVSSLYLCGNVLDPAAMEKEAVARRQIGLEVSLLSAREIQRAFDITRDAALLSQDNLQVDPQRAAVGFLEAARARGAEIFAPVDISGLERMNGGVVATTVAGPRITARFAVLASGYELPSFLPRGDHYIASTWAIATRPQPDNLWPGGSLIWEASDPYLYMRTTNDGRVLCGGEDEEFSDEVARDALIPAKAAAISKKLKYLFPGLDTRPEFAWAGAFGAAETGLPVVAEIPELPDCWLTLGFGGNGMSYAQIAGEIIAAALAGKHDPDLDLYGFD